MTASDEPDASLLATLRSVPDAVIATDALGRVILLNEAARELLSLKNDDALGRPCAEVCPCIRATTGDHLAGALLEVLRTGEAGRFPDDTVVLCADGTKRPVKGHATPMHDDDGTVVGAVVILSDEAEIREAREALGDSEERFRTLSEVTLEGVVILRKGVIVEANLPLARMLRCDREELLGRPVLEMAAPEARDLVLEKIRSGSEEPYEAWGQRGNGEVFPVLIRGSRISYRGEEARVSVLRDLTEQRAAERALRISEEEFRSLFENLAEGITVSDLEGRLLSANPAACQMMGYPLGELLTLRVPDLIAPESLRERPIDLGPVLKGNTILVERQVKRRDGEVFDAEISVRMFGLGRMIALFRDVSQRRAGEIEQQRLRDQLMQSQKMESIGRLAGGIAHDFNNIMTVVLANSSLLTARGDDPVVRAAAIREVEAAGRRAVDLTHRLLAFGRGSDDGLKTSDVDGVVRETEVLLRRLIGEDVELLVTLGEGDRWVGTSSGQVVQILMNLAVNARDAMDGGGTLSIRTNDVEMSEAEAMAAGISPGLHVRIAVADSGSGMDEDTLARAFEPFFTTKPAGEGTGLGLATVYGIAKAAGGTVLAHSTLGQGTTIDVLLPTVRPSKRPQARQIIAAPVVGSEQILMVEDDPMVSRVTRRMLEAGGFRVTSAQSGAEALTMLRTHDSPVDLLLTDVVMPGISGPDLAAELLAERPGLRVLFMSGYADDHLERRGLLHQHALLQKPFDGAQLLGRVREVLDADPDTDDD